VPRPGVHSVSMVWERRYQARERFGIPLVCGLAEPRQGLGGIASLFAPPPRGTNCGVILRPSNGLQLKRRANTRRAGRLKLLALQVNSGDVWLRPLPLRAFGAILAKSGESRPVRCTELSKARCSTNPCRRRSWVDFNPRRQRSAEYG
jgi:hypothetical protein